MIDESQEGIAWPSYVDFLSTFIFVLIIFLGSLMYLMAQGIRQGEFDRDRLKSDPLLRKYGFQPTKGRLQLTVPVSGKGKIQFDTGCPDVGSRRCPGLSPAETATLRNLAEVIGEYHRRCTRIIIRGQTDSKPYFKPSGEIDPLGNYDLSTRRALMILRYLLDCEGCTENFKSQRSKLTLASVGDTLADRNAAARADDRKVSVIIDYSGN